MNAKDREGHRDRGRKQTITTLLAAAYPAWKPSEATMQVYERILRPLEADLAEQAVLQLVRTPREFAPPVGSICYEAARLALERTEGIMSAEEAWAEITAAVRSHGSYRLPRFANPELARAVAAIDWKELCINPNIEATRAHFFRLFAAYQEQRIARRVDKLSGRKKGGELSEMRADRLPLNERSNPATQANHRQGAFPWS